MSSFLVRIKNDIDRYKDERKMKPALINGLKIIESETGILKLIVILLNAYNTITIEFCIVLY